MEVFLCYVCKNGKTAIEMRFSKNSKGEKICKNLCIACDNKRRKDFTRTINGLVCQMYRCNIKNSQRRGHIPPKYSKKELFEWVINQPHFVALYENWKESGYKKDLIPSIDRLDDFKGYSFDNIRLVTWKDNRMKSACQWKNGIGIFEDFCNAVVQISMDGAYIHEYTSCHQAAQAIGTSNANIGGAAMGRQATAAGFQWALKSEYEKNPSKYLVKAYPAIEKIVQLSMDNSFIAIHDSIMAASKSTGILNTAICNCLQKGHHRSSGGFRWRYESDCVSIDI